MNKTTIYYPVELWLRWPSPLANEWAAGYPHIFHKEDLEAALRTGENFCLWFAAVHSFNCHGMLSMVRPYLRVMNKSLRLGEILGQHRDPFARIILEKNLFPPHLVCYRLDKPSMWFALVEGFRCHIYEQHLEAAKFITESLGISVETIKVRQWRDVESKPSAPATTPNS